MLWREGEDDSCSLTEKRVMSTLYISSSPNLSNLEAYVAEFIPTQYFDSGIAQTLKAKCRELARSDAGLLTAPTLESLHAHYGRRVSMKLTIWIVAKIDLLTTSKKIQEKLSELNLSLKKKVKLNHTIFQTCYSFTAIARLAPKWNKISTWMIQGSDFFASCKAPALDFEVNVSASEIALDLKVHKLAFSFFKVEDLGLTPIIANKFKRNPNYVISSNNISTNRCMVLPNLTTAFVHSASHHLPSTPEFPTYDKVRLHWKKQHGIILPEVQDVFYQVFFAPRSRILLSYPGCCVVRNSPLAYPDRDTNFTTSSFIGDLHSRMPSVCGEPVKFSTIPLVPVAELNPASSSGYQTQENVLPSIQVTSGSSSIGQVPFNLKVLGESSNMESSTLIKSGTNDVDTASKRNAIIPSFSAISRDNFELHSSTAVKRSAAMIKSDQQVSQTKKHCYDPVRPSASVSQVVPDLIVPIQNLLSSQVDFSFNSRESDFQDPKLSTSCKIIQPAVRSEETVRLEGITGDIVKKINKSKVAELKKWLQEKGIKYRSKDKKEDLINLVILQVKSTGCAYP